MDKNWGVARTPKSPLDIYHLLSNIMDKSGSPLPKSNLLRHSAVLSGKGCKHATPRSGIGHNHLASEAAEIVSGIKVLDQFY